jgi:hypothetical protein
VRHGLVVGDVHLERGQAQAAFGGETLQRLRVLRVAAVSFSHGGEHMRAADGEPLGRSETEACAGASDEDGLTGEVVAHDRHPVISNHLRTFTSTPLHQSDEEQATLANYTLTFRAGWRRTCGGTRSWGSRLLRDCGLEVDAGTSATCWPSS